MIYRLKLKLTPVIREATSLVGFTMKVEISLYHFWRYVSSELANLIKNVPVVILSELCSVQELK